MPEQSEFIDRRLEDMQDMANTAVALMLRDIPDLMSQKCTVLAGWMPIYSRRLMSIVMLAAGEPNDRVRFVERHEAEHEIAALAVNAPLTGYGIQVAADISNGNCSVRARTGGFYCDTSRLGSLQRATIAAFPRLLSPEGDIPAILANQFESVEHVAFAALRYNAQHHSRPVAVPLSVRTTLPSYFPL